MRNYNTFRPKRTIISASMAQVRAWGCEHPIGDPWGGPLYGEKNGWFSDFIHDPWKTVTNTVTSFVSDPVSYIGDRLKELDKTVIQPIGHTLEKVGQSIEKDPLTFIAVVAATATGNAWAVPLITMASTAAKGGNFEDVLKAGAISTATTFIAVQGTDFLMESMKVVATGAEGTLTTSFKIAGQEISKTTASVIAQAASYGAASATTAAVTGKSVIEAALKGAVVGGVSAGVQGLANSSYLQPVAKAIDGLSDGLSKPVMNAIAGVAGSVLSGQLTGTNTSTQTGLALASGIVGGLASAIKISGDFFSQSAQEALDLKAGTPGASGSLAQYLTDKLGVTGAGLVTNTITGVFASTFTKANVTPMLASQIMNAMGGIIKENFSDSLSFKSLTDKLGSLFDNSEEAAKDYNDKATAQNNLADKINANTKTYNDKLTALTKMYDDFDAKAKVYNGMNSSNSTQAKADAARKELDDLEQDIADYEDSIAEYKTKNIDPLKTQYTAAEKETLAAQKVYINAASKLGTSANPLTTYLNDTAKEAVLDVAKTIDPNFNAKEYAALNGLSSTADAAAHYISVGKDQGLPTNLKAAEAPIAQNVSRLMEETAALTGRSLATYSADEIDDLRDKIYSKYGNNLNALQTATAKSMVAASKLDASDWLDPGGKKYTPASDWFYQTYKGALPFGTKQATQEEVAAGKATLAYLDGGQPVWLASNGKSASNSVVDGTVTKNVILSTYTYKDENGVERVTDKPIQVGDYINKTTGEVVPGIELGADGITRVIVRDPKQFYDVTSITSKGQVEKVALDDLGGLEMMYAYGGLDPKAQALVVDLGGVAASTLISASKSIIDTAKETGNSTLINTAANVIKAGGGFLQSLAGLSVLAGYAPKDTAFGKFAADLVAIGKAGNTAEYTAAINKVQGLLQAAEKANVGADAKTQIGNTLDAIWTGFKGAPMEFLAEYVGVEGFQEIAPFLIGGGASTFAKGAALAKGMGEKFAAEYGAKMGVRAAGLSDIAESVGGAADGAFTEAYKVAREKGMSEAQATQTALSIATSTGIVSGLLTAGSMGIGGLAMEKALIGSGVASGALGKAIDNLADFAVSGGKITLKEGLSEAGEEGLTQAFLEGQLYKLDPTRPVAGNIAAAASFGALAGGPIAGGTYALSEGTNIISNVLMANPTVAKIVSEAKTTAAGAATAATLLAGLGISGTAQADILNKVYDAGYTSSAEAAAALKTYDNFNPTQADINALTGATPDAQFKAKADAYVDPKVTDFAEAKAMLTSLGYKPTDAEVQKFVGQVAETSSKTKTATYADTHTVTAAEAKQFMKDLGYTNPTTAEINQFVFSGANIDQNKLKADLGKYVDTHQVTEAEAKKYFADLGYKPTDAEIKSFVKQGATIDESAVQKGVGTYVDPRQVTTAEATKMLTDLGYSKPTAAEIANFVGQGGATKAADVLKAATTYVDTHTVSEAEVINYFKNQGYTAKDATEIAKYVAQGATVDQAKTKVAAEAYADPLAVLASEAKDYFAKEGYVPSVEELKKYTGVMNEADTAKLIYAYADPLVMTDAEARAYMKQAGYTNPTDAEVAKFTKQAKESDLKTALLSYVDTHQVTEAEAKAFYKALGYVPTKAEIAQFVTQGVNIQQKVVEAKLSEYVDPRYATADEIRQAYLDMGFGEPTQADIDRFIGQRDEAAAIKEAEDYLPIATYHATKDQIANVQKTLLEKMAEYEKAGLARDEALAKAIDEVAADVGATKTQILDAIGTPAVADNPATKDVNEAKPATGIYATIDTQLAATKKDILDQVAAYEQAGIDRDTALDLAITGVAQDLGTTKADLLSKIDTTEATLKTEIGAVKTELSSDIKTVAELVGKPVQEVTQADLDYVNSILNVKEGETAPTVDLTYDVNRDGKIDTTDKAILESQLKVQLGTDIETKTDPNTGIETKIDTKTGQVIETFNPQTGSRWAPTGVYKTLADQEAARVATTKAQAETAKQTQQKQNFMQMMQMVLGAPDAAGQKVTVQTPDPARINYIYDWNSIFATPQQAGMMPSPYGAINTYGQPMQQAGIGSLYGQQQPQQKMAIGGFAEGGMIGGDISVGGGGEIDDLLNILKGNSG